MAYSLVLILWENVNQTLLELYLWLALSLLYNQLQKYSFLGFPLWPVLSSKGLECIWKRLTALSTIATIALAEGKHGASHFYSMGTHLELYLRYKSVIQKMKQIKYILL